MTPVTRAVRRGGTRSMRCALLAVDVFCAVRAEPSVPARVRPTCRSNRAPHASNRPSPRRHSSESRAIIVGIAGGFAARKVFNRVRTALDHDIMMNLGWHVHRLHKRHAPPRPARRLAGYERAALLRRELHL